MLEYQAIGGEGEGGSGGRVGGGGWWCFGNSPSAVLFLSCFSDRNGVLHSKRTRTWVEIY